MNARTFLPLTGALLAGLLAISPAHGQNTADVTLLALTESVDASSPFVDFADRFDSLSFLLGPVINGIGDAYITARVRNDSGQMTTGLYTRFGSGPGSPFAVIRGGDDAPGVTIEVNGEQRPLEWSSAPVIYSVDRTGNVAFPAFLGGASDPYQYQWFRSGSRYDLAFWAWRGNRTPGAPTTIERFDMGPSPVGVQGRFLDRPRALFLTGDSGPTMEGRFLTQTNEDLRGIFVKENVGELRSPNWKYLGPGRVVRADVGEIFFEEQVSGSVRSIQQLRIFGSAEPREVFGIGMEIESKSGSLQAVTKISGYDFFDLRGLVVQATLENGESGYWLVGRDIQGSAPPLRLYSDLPPYPIELEGGVTENLFFLSIPRAVGGAPFGGSVYLSVDTALYRKEGSSFLNERWERVLRQGDALPGVDWTVWQIDRVAVNTSWSREIYFVTIIGLGFPAPKGIFAIREDGSVVKVIEVGEEVAPGIVVEDLLQHPDQQFPSSSTAVYGGEAANARGEMVFIAKVRRESDGATGEALVRTYVPSSDPNENRRPFIRKIGPDLVEVSWPGNRKIEESAGGPWVELEGAKSPIQIPQTSARRFYRYQPE